MTLTEEVMQAALGASEDRKQTALKILNGYELKAEPKPEVERFLTLKELAKATGFSTTSLWRFRAPKRPMAGRPRFLLSEFLAYIESPEFRAQARRLRRERSQKPAMEAT